MNLTKFGALKTTLSIAYMKTKILLLFMTVFALTFSACSDDDEGGDESTEMTVMLAVGLKLLIPIPKFMFSVVLNLLAQIMNIKAKENSTINKVGTGQKQSNLCLWKTRL